MRCENCGWDKNPVESVKCKKCNAPLTGSMVAGNSIPNHKKRTPAEEFDLPETVKRCKSCGYVPRTGATICPNCGSSVSEPAKPNLKTETFIQRKRLAGFLVSYSRSPVGDFFPLYDGRNAIGRDSSNDIVIADQTVSGEHLLIACYSENRKFYFETVGLTQNGTYVNGVFFPGGGGELADSSVIIVGSTRLFFMAIPETAFEQ